MEVETLLSEHPLFCSAIVFTVTALYFRIQSLLTEQKGHAPYGIVKQNQADEITVASTFSSNSSREVRELQSKLTMCEKVIQSLQNELKSSANESEQMQASLETERFRATIMEEEGEEAKQLLEKECAKVLNLQSTHSANRSEFHDLAWDEADTMISLVKIQKQVYELDSQISYERLRLINKHKILEVEKNRTSIHELVGARSKAEMFLKAETQKIEASHRALEESICIIEENQEKLSSDQFQAYDVQDKLMKEVKDLESKVAAKETVSTSQKQQIVHLQRLNEAENQKAENQQTAGKLKLEAMERKLQASTKETEYQNKRSEDLRDLHSAEKHRADRLQGDQSNKDAVVRLKDTKIEALEMKITALKEKETAHQKQIENLKNMHSDAKEKVARHQSQETKLNGEKMERENALEKVNLKMEEKLEALSKQKNQLQHFEQVHAEEQEKANKINEQLPQLLNLIKTEETKGLKLQQLLQETNVLLQSEKFKVEGLEKGLANMSAMIKSKEGKIETLERDRFNRIMQSNQTGEQQGDKKGWFWKQ
jgi:hypothetical protein